MALAVLLVGCNSLGWRRQPESLRVLAAASLVDVLGEAARATRPGAMPVVGQFAASAEARRQIENGAPADVFISADGSEMDVLQRRGLLVEGTRRPLYGNRLVLVQPLGAPVSLHRVADLATAGVRRIGMGEPGTVPAGRYAEQALQRLGLLDGVKARLVMGTNVRVVLGWVERGEVDAAFVYQTDARAAAARVQVVEVLPQSSHDPVVYPAAVVAGSRHVAEARAFIAYLASPQGGDLARRFGFELLAPETVPASPVSAPKP